MTERKTLKLRVDACGRGTVAIDDLDISDSVVAVRLETDVNSINRVTVTFLAVNLDIEADTVLVEEVRP